MEFVYIPKKEFELLTKAKENLLTSRDGEVLVEYWAVFEKFLKKSQFSLQIGLSEWKYRGKEESIWNTIEWLNDVIKSLKSIPDSMESYNAKVAEEEAKKEQKKKKK